MSIYDVASNILEVLEMIEQGDSEDDALADTLEALQGELEYKVNSWCNVIKNKENDINGIAEEIKRLQQKKNTKENEVKKMKAVICVLLTRLGYGKFKTATYSLNRFRETIEIDKKQVPEEFKIEVQRTVKEPDKENIKKALESGKNLPFAKIMKSLTIQ